MEGYLSTRTIAEEIYSKSAGIHKKTVLEVLKEEEIIREALEMSMSGLDNNGRQEVLSEINIRLENGDKSFYDSTGVNFDKVKDITKGISLQVIRHKNNMLEDEEESRNQVVSEKSAKESYEENVQQKIEQISKYCEGIPEDIIEAMARYSIQAEYDEKEIQALIEQGNTEEEALKKYFNNDQVKIAVHKQTRRRDISIEKAEKTGRKDDIEIAQKDSEISVQIVRLNNEIFRLRSTKDHWEKSVLGLEGQILTIEIALQEGRGTEEDKKALEEAKLELEETKRKLEETEKEIKKNEEEIVKLGAEPNKDKKERVFNDEERDSETGELVSQIEEMEKRPSFVSNVISKIIGTSNKKDTKSDIDETKSQASKKRFAIVQKIEDIGSLELLGYSKQTLEEVLGNLEGFFELGIDEEAFFENLENLKNEDYYNAEIYERIGEIGFGVPIEDNDAVLKKIQDVKERLLGEQEIEVTAETKQAIEQQPLPEEVSAELNAIPVALQRINCSPEEIAEGMEAYKQVIETLTPEEIDAEPAMLAETLKKAVGERGLDVVAGDILKMMSQINFNGQISEILKNCKDEFMNSLETISLQGPLMDPRVYVVEPEQYSESSTSSAPTERIDDETLKVGFAALAVDLQIADQTIIRTEELVSDNVSLRREDAEIDSSRDEQDGEIIESEAPENDANASNNSVKVTNVMNMARKIRPTTDIMQEMGKVVAMNLREQDGPQVEDPTVQTDEKE